MCYHSLGSEGLKLPLQEVKDANVFPQRGPPELRTSLCLSPPTKVSLNAYFSPRSIFEGPTAVLDDGTLVQVLVSFSIALSEPSWCKDLA